MKKTVLAVASCLLISSLADAQYLETVIDQGDTLCVLGEVTAIAYVPSNNSVYVSDDVTVVVDAARKVRTAWLPICAWASFYNPVNGLLYLGGFSICVLDPATNSVVAEVPVRVPYEKSQAFALDSARNRLYVAGARGDSVHIIDCNQNTLVTSLPVGAVLYALCYASVADKVYCVNQRGGVTVIDASGDSVVGTIPTTGGVTLHPLSYSPVNNRLYCTTEYDGMLVIDCASDSVIGAVQGNHGGLWYGWYNPNRNTIHALDFFGWGCAVVDCSTDSIVSEFPTGISTGISTCLNAASQKFYYTDYDSRFGVVDCVGDSAITRMLVGAVRSCAPLCVNQMSNEVYCGNNSGMSVSVIDGVSDRLAALVPLSCFRPSTLCYIPGRDVVYCGNDVGVISVIDAYSNRVIASSPTGLAARKMVLVPQERKVYVLNAGIQVFSSVNDSLLTEIHTAHIGESLVYVPGGKIYCNYGSPRGTEVVVFDPHADTIVAELDVGLTVRELLVSPNRNELYASCWYSELVMVIDGGADTVAGSIALPRPAIALALSRTLDRLYCLHDSDAISVIDCGLRQVVETAAAPTSTRSYDVLWNSVSDKLYYAGERDSLVVFSCEDNRVEAVIGLSSAKPLLCDTIANRVYVSCGAGVAVVDGVADSVLAVIPTDPAGHQVACWSPVERRVYVAGPPLNGSSIAVIGDATGIAEPLERGARVSSIIRGSIVLGRGQHKVLFDVSGRKVMKLAPGENDVSRLAPGVYFIKEQSAISSQYSGRDASSVTKVVVQR